MWKSKNMSVRIGIVLALIFTVSIISNNTDKELMDRSVEMSESIVVAFPLRGEWLSPNTPGSKIPSHGTDQLGTRYAYDFIQVNREKMGWPAYRVSFPHYLLFGVPLSDYYCWGQDVYAPCDGIVVAAEDGYEEGTRTNLISDLSNANRNAHYFDPRKDDIQSVAGNYIIIRIDDNIYAALAHLQTGSVQVTAGQTIKKGELIGRVGNSGNSLAPHLHFQLMDSSDMATANGLPCAFEEYEVFRDGEWQNVKNGIPKDRERIRVLKLSYDC